ncbi:hypothetical protein RclHR1_08500005 [Rhizophagus clarus]|uniref:Protein kinase domain-containing protein n=1 Tax=Rhizophagus clarus TaxID=94130 RepID=A0A2Z6SFD8_9GLOM|nr:hypothetical protein RclHR1_08500005 [Rhizophagus clarus]
MSSRCEDCEEVRTNTYYKFCSIPCHLEYFEKNFANYINKSEKINDFIQQVQIKSYLLCDNIIKWIPYNQFKDIKIIADNVLATTYSAVWSNFSLDYDNYDKMLSNKKVTLKCLYYSQDMIHGFSEEIQIFSHQNIEIYGISKDPDTSNYVMVLQDGIYCEKCGNQYTVIYIKWCSPCQINNLKQNFANWTNENEKINDIIQDGPLEYDENKKKKGRIPNKNVILKCLCKSENNTSEFLYKVRTYKKHEYYINKIYGISQNPKTKDYIMILNDYHCEKCGKILSFYAETGRKWCILCQIKNINQNFANWTSGNKKIDGFIQDMQLNLSQLGDIIIEWIPYDQFTNIKRIDKSTTLHSETRTDGLLRYDPVKYKWKRIPNKMVILKYLNNLNEIKTCQSKVYGISQSPDTNDYIMILSDHFCCNTCGYQYDRDIDDKWCKSCQISNLKQNFANWTSGNEKINGFIQELQSKIEKPEDIIIEWIPYNQFINIKKIGKGTKKDANKEVVLKYLCNSQDNIREFLDELESYLSNKHVIYGISQKPDTKNYIVILQNNYCKDCGKAYTSINNKWCNPCQVNNLKQNFANWTSKNEKIDGLIQEMQLNIEHRYDNIIAEWIPYDTFKNIKEINKNDFAKFYSAIWKDGPLCYSYDKGKLIRLPNNKVVLKCLYNIQDTTNEFLNVV